jgi:hypothetical protein
MPGITIYSLILTMNINGISSPNKNTNWLTGFKRKTWHSSAYNKLTLQTETNIALGWKGRRIYQPNSPPKQAGVAILILDKVYFKPKLVRRAKEGDFILIKGAIHQEEIRIVNLYAPNVSAPNFIKHTLLDLRTQTDPIQW